MVAIGVLILIATASGAPLRVARYQGVFALPHGAKRVNARLSVTYAAPLAAHLDLAESLPRTSSDVRDFDTEMQKKLHLIVISDDFQTFLHVHPVLAVDGHFRIDLRVPRAASYHIYADDVPHGLPQQVFRFDVPFGDPKPAQPIFGAASTWAQAGPYTVRLNTSAISANRSTVLSVAITRNGRPATDLRAYLGGAAHAVFIEGASLAYVHVHPVTGSMPAMSGSMPMMHAGSAISEKPMAELPEGATIPATMRLPVEAPAAGTYKLWLQFRGGERLYVATFALTAR